MANAKPFKQVRTPAHLVPGRGRGQPSLYDSSYCQIAIDYMSKGFSLTALAAELGVSRESVYAWIAAHPDFSDAITKAKAARVRALEVKLLSTSMGVGVTAAIFALKNAEPDQWQDRYNTETNINIRVDRIPDDELMRIASSGRQPMTIEHDACDVTPALPIKRDDAS